MIMNHTDELLALGFALGCLLTGLLATVLWAVRDALQGPMNLPVNQDWPEN